MDIIIVITISNSNNNNDIHDRKNDSYNQVN